jgi:uncharacterized protein
MKGVGDRGNLLASRLTNSLVAGFLCLLLLMLSTTACRPDETSEDDVPQWDPLEQSVINVMASMGESLDRYWKERFTQFSAGAYRSPTSVVPYRGGSVPDLGCGIRDDSPEKWARNAVYCAEDQKIAYDVQLIIEEGKQFGALPSLLVLAHEWGHHIQSLDGQLRNNSLPIELGADCYLGMFAAHVDEAGLFSRELASAAGSLRTAAASVFLSGHTYQQWFDPGVHGTPRERATAFRTGVLTEDASYCRAYAGYQPQAPRRMGRYTVELPPGVETTSNSDQEVGLRFGSVEARLRAYPQLPSRPPAEGQIRSILGSRFSGLNWQPSGPITDTSADPNFGGSKAVQPYSLMDRSGRWYGAALLHVAETGGGVLIDVRTRGDIATAGAEAFQPVGDFMYTLLARTCPPGTNEVVCTQPLGSRPARG